MVELNIRSKVFMKIHAYFFCKNEELILPYLLKHYGEFCEKITFFDNESTDRSREIIEAFTQCETEIITNSTGGVLRDDIHLHLKNNCWKGVDADYVIVADADEFLYNENLVDFLTESTLDKPTWITDMVNHNYIIRKYFDKVVHGAPVNSIFKKFELDREDVWFIHK